MAAAGPGKKLCGAKTKTGTCRNVAGKGTDHLGTGTCSRHLGSTGSHKVAAEREAQRQACDLFGLQMADRPPAEVLLAEVTRTRRSIAWHETEIALLMAAGKTEGLDSLMARWMLERKHLADVTAKAIQSGAMVKLVEIEGEKARVLAAVLVDFARRLGHDPTSKAVREAGRGALQLVAGGQA